MRKHCPWSWIDCGPKSASHITQQTERRVLSCESLPLSSVGHALTQKCSTRLHR
jgi:hypothetical protein